MFREMEGERRTHHLMMDTSIAGMQEGGSRGFGLLKRGLHLE